MTERHSSSTEHLLSSHQRMFHRGLSVIQRVQEQLMTFSWFKEDIVEMPKLNSGEYLLGITEGIEELVKKLEDGEFTSIYLQNNHPLYTLVEILLEESEDIDFTHTNHAGLGSNVIKIWRKQSPLQK